MRTDWQNMKAGDVVQARNGQRLTIAQVITRDLPIDFNRNTKPCVIAASREHFDDDKAGMWYFIFDEGNYYSKMHTTYVTGGRRGEFAFYSGCTPSPYDAIGYYKGFVQQSLFV